jgi:internalin A
MQLNLNRTHVTDAGLVHLKGLTKLHVLEIVGTQVTEEGAKELEQALPLMMSYR